MNTRTSPVDTPRTDLVARLREPSFRHCNCETCKFIDEAATALEQQARRIAVLEAAVRQWASECGSCHGTGLVGRKHFPGGIEVDYEAPCEDCADIRDVLEEKP